MPRALIVTGLVLMCSALEPAPSQAMDGCCKRREDSGWSIVNRTFAQCDAANADSDGDDIFEPSGQWGWDSACQDP